MPLYIGIESAYAAFRHHALCFHEEILIRRSIFLIAGYPVTVMACMSLLSGMLLHLLVKPGEIHGSPAVPVHLLDLCVQRP